jgi:hypothetical protein
MKTRLALLSLHEAEAIYLSVACELKFAAFVYGGIAYEEEIRQQIGTTLSRVESPMRWSGTRHGQQPYC